LIGQLPQSVIVRGASQRLSQESFCLLKALPFDKHLGQTVGCTLLLRVPLNEV
jgi:hypothetical protein